MVTLINFDFSKSLNLSSQKPQSYSIFYNQKKKSRKRILTSTINHTHSQIFLFHLSNRSFSKLKDYFSFQPIKDECLIVLDKKMNKQKKEKVKHTTMKQTYTHTQRKLTVYKISTRRLQPHFCVDIRWLKKKKLICIILVVSSWTEMKTSQTKTHKHTNVHSQSRRSNSFNRLRCVQKF